MTTSATLEPQVGHSPSNSEKDTPYDQFNLTIPVDFPEEGMSAKAAHAVVMSECWTDANPMLNLSSFVTTFTEPEARDDFASGSFRNFADPDMYPHTKETEFTCVRWLHELWNGPKNAEPYGAATVGSSEACMLAGWRTNGIGVRREKKPGRTPATRIWSPAAMSRSSGRNS